MSIAVGETLPSVTLKTVGGSGIEDLNIAEYVKGKRVVIFGLPGAFTPACAQQHLPGYVEQADEILAKGVDEILCVAVNDPFVMSHWGESSGAAPKITMIPDGNAEFTKAVGLDFDGSGFGLATRSQRYMMIVQDGVVEALEIEGAPSDVELSSARACLAKLG